MSYLCQGKWKGIIIFSLLIMLIVVGTVIVGRYREVYGGECCKIENVCENECCNKSDQKCEDGKCCDENEVISSCKVESYEDERESGGDWDPEIFDDVSPQLSGVTYTVTARLTYDWWIDYFCGQEAKAYDKYGCQVAEIDEEDSWDPDGQVIVFDSSKSFTVSWGWIAEMATGIPTGIGPIGQLISSTLDAAQNAWDSFVDMINAAKAAFDTAGFIANKVQQVMWSCENPCHILTG